MPVLPYIKNPLTDLTGTIYTNQHFGRCRKLEMTMYNCLEAYGLERGNIKCKDIIDDFKECFSREKQEKRIEDMQAERKRLIKSGEKTAKELYIDPPRPDAVYYT